MTGFKAQLIGSIPAGKGVCRQAPVILHDERHEDEIVVFTTSEGQVQAWGFNAKESDSLVQLWGKDQIDNNEGRFSPPFSEMALSGMGLLALADEEHLYLLDAHTGTTLGHVPSGRITSKPVFRKDHFEIVTSTRETINSYSFLNSPMRLDWSVQAAHYAGPVAFTQDGEKLIAAAGSQRFSNGVKIAGYDNHLLRINPNDGKTEKTVAIGSRARSLAVSSQGLIYAGAFKSFSVHHSDLQTIGLYASPSPDLEGDVTSLLAAKDGVIAGSEGSFSRQGSWGKIHRFQTGLDRINPEILQMKWEKKYSGRGVKLALSKGILAIGNREDITFLDMKSDKVILRRLPVASPIAANENGVFSWSDGEKVHLYFCGVDAPDALNAPIIR